MRLSTSQTHAQSNMLKRREGTLRAAAQSETEENKEVYKHFVLHVVWIL